ncbi:MAG: hypothetical protein KDA05_01470 [Phycisphaerales bacterium]|nr:hypothetical protein [Phycisphaerales bacterium]
MPSVPPLPQASETIEEVFLTPRVLDGRAFEDYSASLTRLIKDASAEGQTLSRTAADVRVLKEQLGEAAGEAQRRLDTAMKVVAALERRAAGEGAGRNGVAEPKAAKASEVPPAEGDAVGTIEARVLARVQQAIEARIREEVERRVARDVASVLDARLGEMVEAWRADNERLRQEFWSLVEETRGLAGQAIERVEGRVEEREGREEREAGREDREAEVGARVDEQTMLRIEKSLADAGERAARFEKSVEAAARRFASETNEQGARVTAEAREAIEAARQECDAAVRQITTGASLRVRKAKADAEEALAAFEHEVPVRLGEARDRFEAMFRDLSADAQQQVAWIKAALGEVNAVQLDQIRAACEQARALVEADDAADCDAGATGVERGEFRAGIAEGHDSEASVERPRSLVGLVRRATALRRSLDADMDRVEELGKQVGLMRDLLSRSIVEGATRIDQIDQHQEELLSSTARAIERYAQEIEAMKASLVVGPGSPGAPGSPAADDAASDESRQAADDRLRELKTHTDEAARAAEWLAGLIDRAAQVGVRVEDGDGDGERDELASPVEPASKAGTKRSARASKGRAKPR